jgi:hypothetical protein
MIMRRIVTAVVAVAALLTLGACGYDDDFERRQQQVEEAQKKNTLEKQNLQRKLDLEEDPNRIGYVYLVSFGDPIGYYTIKGKVSANGSQLEPEDQLLQPYSGGERYVVDGPQDDGTYGEGDPGIFFFTTEDTMVVTSMDYFYSSQPIPNTIKVPKLN